MANLWPNKIGHGEINFGKTIKNYGKTKLDDRNYGKKIGKNENSPKALARKISKRTKIIRHKTNGLEMTHGVIILIIFIHFPTPQRDKS